MKAPVVLSLVLLLAAGCGGEEPAPTTTTTTSTTTTGETTTSPATTTTPAATSRPPATPTTPSQCAPVAGGGTTHLQLTAVRVGTHPGYDRVAFEFAPSTSPSAPPAPPGVLPKYEVRRVTALIEDGSGNPVMVAGEVLYQVVFQGASGVDLSGNQPVITYHGPREFRPNFRTLLEAERTGDFEATLSWGFGLRDARCPRATELRDPLRLAIDFPH